MLTRNDIQPKAALVGFQGLAATSLTGAGWSDDAAWLNAKRDFDARIAPFE